MSSARGRLIAAKETGDHIEVTIRLDANQWRRIQYAFGQGVFILDEDAGERWQRSLPTIEDMAGIFAKVPADAWNDVLADGDEDDQ